MENNVTLNVEDTLNLTCSVTATGLLSLGVEVIWLVKGLGGSDNQRVLLHVGRDGQVLIGSELVGMSRVQPDTFRLLLPKVQLSDSGLYSCQVKCWLPQGGGGWYQAAEKTSDPVQVRVTQLGKKNFMSFFSFAFFTSSVPLNSVFPIPVHSPCSSFLLTAVFVCLSPPQPSYHIQFNFLQLEH